jgi:hypothetical protein
MIPQDTAAMLASINCDIPRKKCEQEGCGTILSAYNSSGRCSLHGSPLELRGENCTVRSSRIGRPKVAMPLRRIRAINTLCTRCGAPPVPGKRLCEKHMSYERERNLASYYRRKGQ